LTLPGKVFASTGTMLLKTSLLNFTYPFGQILAPSCSAVSQVASPSVPLTTQREISFGSIDVCFESPDQSSCPTKIYSCSKPGYSACNCPSGSEQFWTEVDLGIGAEHRLSEVWTNSDPRCPITLLDIESCPCSKCAVIGGITKCNTYSTYPPCKSCS
jgi:hypothetical protein